MRRLAFALIPSLCLAQATFEVASVRRQAWTGSGSVGIFARNDTLRAEHVSLNDLVLYAYGLRPEQLSGGPGWADRSGLKVDEAELYQVTAKASGSPSPEAFREMLRSLLAERFQLKVRRTRKNLPRYELTLSGSAPKLKPSEKAEHVEMSSAEGNGLRLSAAGITISRLVQLLSTYVDHPLDDKTGLTGTFDIEIDFLPPAAPLESAGDAPSLAAALRDRLGLRLEKTTGLVETVVIEHAERPTEN